MEAYLYVNCCCNNELLKAVILDCLSVDGPVFEEDVAPEYAEVFRILEYIDPPDDLKQTDDGIIKITWMLRSVEFYEEACELLLKLDKAGIEELAAEIEGDEFRRRLKVNNQKIKSKG